MANVTHSRKTSVDLATPVTRVSRIRRDPPPVVKKVSAADIREREARTVVIGIITMTLASLVVLFGVSNATGWSPSQYTINLR